MHPHEAFSFVDGGRAKHSAHIEPGDDTDRLVMNVFGEVHRVPICLYPNGDEAPPVGCIAKQCDTQIALLCYALLHAFMNVWKLSYGAQVAFEMDGRRLIARYQEHPPDAGIGRPHPGVTVFEYVAADANTALVADNLAQTATKAAV